MDVSFRSEVFRLCKSLLDNPRAREIRTLVHDLSVSVEDKGTGMFKNNLHGDLAYVAKSFNNQFHGYLFADENADTLGSPIPFKIEHLSNEERKLIEQGHQTLNGFAKLCLEEIGRESEAAAAAMNPYALYKEVKCGASKGILSDEEIQNAVTAFRNGKVYQALIRSSAIRLFEKLDKPAFQQLLGTVEQAINTSFDGKIPEDIRDFALGIRGRYQNITEVMFAFSILMFALKESLRMACQLFYEAICGIDLLVLNNDNIIRVEDRISNLVYQKCKVLIQGMPIRHVGRSVGSIVLMDCDPTDDVHLHEFGMVTAITESISKEMGSTTKYTFLTVNEELIHIHNITDGILRSGVDEIKIRG